MSAADLRTVLYVDDEPTSARSCNWRSAWSTAWTYKSASPASARCSMLPDITPDLVLLDVMMPGTDGPTTLQRMRADPRFANIPVVFVTAKAMPAEVARFRELGAVAVIAKPFDPMQFGQQIVTIWEGIDHG